MKKWFILFFLFYLSGCQNQQYKSGGDSVKDAYDSYKNGYKAVITGSTNDLSAADLFYIELQESATPYKWICSGSNNVTYLDDDSFDLNDGNPAGGSVRHIWRFKCGVNGGAQLVYNKQRIGDSGDLVDTKSYNISVK